MAMSGAVRAGGLPTGADERPTPVLDGAKAYRPARVLVVEPEAGEWSLVVTLPTETVTRVLRVNGSTGELHPCRGVRGHDVFGTEADALEALYASGRIHATLAGRAVLGLAPLPAAGLALLLVATRVRAGVTLPGGHDVHSVTEAMWVKLPLQQQQQQQQPPLPGPGDGDADLPDGGAPPPPGESPKRTPSRAADMDGSPPPRANAAAAVALGNALLEYPVEGCHFYCHTADVTRPWPWGGPHAATGAASEGGDPPAPDPEFTWNGWLAEPFARAGCGCVCPPLVQGLAECRLLADAKGARACVALLARRSRLHPGTRYLARGLNDAASPGNEVECEQLLFRVADPLGAAALQALSLSDSSSNGALVASASPQQPQQPQARVSQHQQHQEQQPWCSVVWRRGTVPIRWGTEITSTVGEAELYVSAKDPYNGTATYFARLCDTYARTPRGGSSGGMRHSSSSSGGGSNGIQDDHQLPSSGDGQPAPREFTVTCVNLLRSSLRAPELLLTEHFHEGVRSARRQQPAVLGGVRVLNFDWHGNIKALGEAAAVEGLWTQLHAACASCGLSVGWDAPAAAAGVVAATRGVTAWQRGMLRYNCADSLDRTNLASFFGAVQLLMQQAQVLGLVLEQANVAAPSTGGAGAHVSTPSTSSASTAAGAGAEQQPMLAVMPGRRVTPGAVSLWAQQAAQGGRVNTVPDMPGVHQPRTSAISATSAAAVAAAAGSSGGVSTGTRVPPLPPGWESRIDAATGCTFYIDHNTRSTTWTRPAPPATAASPGVEPAQAALKTPVAERNGGSGGGSNGRTDTASASSTPEPRASGAQEQPELTFASFNRTVDDMRASLLPCVTHALAELFALNGDLHAALYTGSRALNSGMIALLDPPGSTRPGVRLGGAAGAASSIGISVQRRFVNLTLDSSRQLALEAFLGIHAAAAQGEVGASGGNTGLSGDDSGDSALVLSAAAANAAPPRSERLFAHR